MEELNLLQEKILSDGVIRPGNVLKVDSFLNHQIDVPFISELGKEFKKLFGDRKVDKILTIKAVRSPVKFLSGSLCRRRKPSFSINQCQTCRRGGRPGAVYRKFSVSYGSSGRISGR